MTSPVRGYVRPSASWPLSILIALLLYGAPVCGWAQPPTAPGWISSASDAGTVELDLDEAVLAAEPGPGATVYVANPDIADAQSPDNRRVIVVGKKYGRTSLFVFSAAGVASRYAVVVHRPTAVIAEALRAIVPSASIDVTRSSGGMIVAGRVASPAQAAALKAAATQFLADKETLDFAVAVEASTQVNLRVRVAEVSRSVTKSLGFNWNSVFNNGSFAVGLMTGRTGIATALGQFVAAPGENAIGFGYAAGNVDLSAVVDALETSGLITILAEPNLTAISGSSASFLSGGEFPVPISTTLGQVSVEWKKFGISVDFTPTVLDANRISIHVRPEVSELSDTGAVVINGFKVPSLAVRRAETTVELASGQSFAIAGLFQNNISSQIQQFPGLGHLPVLGALFRSSSFKKDQSELVIIITPYIVRPVAAPGDLHLPTEAVTFSSTLEQILQGRLNAADGPAHLIGSAGFMQEKP
jgi:pilus assembly protein CpaC